MNFQFTLPIADLKRIITNLSKFVDKKDTKQYFLTCLAIGQKDKGHTFIAATNGHVLAETLIKLDEESEEFNPYDTYVVKPSDLLEVLAECPQKRKELVTVKVSNSVEVNGIKVNLYCHADGINYPDLLKLNESFNSAYKTKLASKFLMKGKKRIKEGYGFKDGIDAIALQSKIGDVKGFKKNAVVGFTYTSEHYDGRVYGRKLKLTVQSRRGINAERFVSVQVGDIIRREDGDHEFYGLPSNGYSFEYLSHAAELLSKSKIDGWQSEVSLLQLRGDEGKVSYVVTIMPII